MMGCWNKSSSHELTAKHLVLSLGFLLLMVTLVPPGTDAEPTTDPDEIAKICRISIQVQDPICKNGGYLRAENKTAEPTSCADCICPPNWDGVDCSLCTAPEFCPPLQLPDGTSLPASACITDHIAPQEDEKLYGKRLQCWCGGDDASTQFLCDQQPGTTWDIALAPSNETFSWDAGNAYATVSERAGTYSADDVPDWPCKAGDDCFTRDRWNYAYPGVWDGSFQGCTWTTGECITPMEGEDCLVFTCKDSNVHCPSSYAQKCPGWTPVSCGTVPDGNKPFWTHHCLPGTYPTPGKALKLACKQDKGPDGAFQCYITQEGSYVSSLGMRCKTGTCIYNPPTPPPPPVVPPAPGPDPGPDPTPTPGPDPSPGPPAPAPTPTPSPAPPKPKPQPKVAPEITVLVLMGLGLAGVVAAAGYWTYQDSQRAAQWMMSTQEGGGGGGGGGSRAAWTASRHVPASLEQPLAEPLLPASFLSPSQHDTPETVLRMGDTGGNGYGGDDHGDHMVPVVPVTLTWQDVHFRVTKRNGRHLHILKGVSGVAGHFSSPGVRGGSSGVLSTPAVPSDGGWDAASLDGASPKAAGTVPGTPSSVGGPGSQLGKGLYASSVATGGVAGASPGSSAAQLAGAGGAGGLEDRLGSMFAVLGPSGAGKTTLIDILSGRRHGQGVTGEIRLNGHLVGPSRMQSMCGYVMQDDVLPGTLTVYEYLCFSAALKLPPARNNTHAHHHHNNNTEQHTKQVWSIIRQLGLSKVAHSFIGDAFVRGLSGGEKRRVSIAVELLTRPGVLLLDEPTTGLDSTNAARVVDIMSSLAHAGVTVVMSIHQPRPDIFRLMDRVLLMSGDGQPVYSGPVSGASHHLAALGAPSPAPGVAVPDFMLDLVIRSSREQLVELVDAFRASSISNHDDVLTMRLAEHPLDLPPDKYTAPFTTQLSSLSSRLLRNTYRHPFLVALNFTATLCAAIAVGLIFRHSGTDTGGIQNRLGVLFFCLLYLALMTLSSLPVWREERLLYLRERDTGLYRTPAYFTAVVMFELLPLRVIPPVFFALCAYWVIGLHPGCASCVVWFVWFLVAGNVTSTTLCMAIGAASPSNPVANLVASLSMMMFMLFGGFLLNKERVPVYCRAVAGASFFNYAYEGLAINEFHKYPGDFYFTAPLNTTILPPLRITGDGVLREFGFNQDAFYVDVVMLVVLTLTNCCVTYVVLALMGTPRAEQMHSAVQHARDQAVAQVRRVLARACGYPPDRAGLSRECDEITRVTPRKSRARKQGGQQQAGRAGSGRSGNVSAGQQTRSGSVPVGQPRSSSVPVGSKPSRGASRDTSRGPLDLPSSSPPLPLSLHPIDASPPEPSPLEAPADTTTTAELASSPHEEAVFDGFGAQLGGGGGGAGRAQPQGFAAVAHLPGGGDAAGGGGAGVNSDDEDDDDEGEREPLIPAGAGAELARATSVDTCIHVAGPPCVLSWDNLSCSIQLPGGRTRYVLQSVSGVAGPTPDHVLAAAAAQKLPGEVLTARVSPLDPDLSPSPGDAAAAAAGGGGAGAGRPQGKAGGVSVLQGSQPGGSCLFAILGPSGAGKTTLLDILSGRRSGPLVTGEVRANGRLVPHLELRRMSGYVQQDAVLPGTSTVSEYLGFHARLRMPQDTSPAEVAARVETVTAQLGLSKVAHSFIGDAFVRGLSGGEKRRVSIAVELLTRPGVLLLDEPTTGLDSTNAARVVDIMSSLAHAGVTVVMSIHQPRPDIFRLMDRVLLMSGDGQVVFTGPTALAPEHFAALGYHPPSAAMSIADYVLDLVIKAPPETVAQLLSGWQRSDVGRHDSVWVERLVLNAAMAGTGGDDAVVPHKYEATYWQQLSCLCSRLAANAVRHPLLITLNWVFTALMALGIGAVYWDSGRDTGGIQDRFGSLFFQLLYLALIGLSSLPLWADDRLLFVRERAAGAYGTAAYFTAVVLFDVLPMRVLPPVFFITFSYWMIGLRPLGLYWAKTLLVLVMCNITSTSVSMSIGAAVPSVALANMLGSLALLVSMLFGGFLLSRNKMPGWIGWAANLSYVRYAFEALLDNEFHGTTGYRFTAFHQPGAPPDQIPHVDVTGDEILMTFGFALDAYWWDVAALGGLSVVALTATFLLLKYSRE